MFKRKNWAVFFAAICLVCMTAAAYAANVTLITNSALRTVGIDSNRFVPICFSPDGEQIAGYLRGTKKDIAAGNAYTFVILNIEANGSLKSAKTYPLTNLCPKFNQACFTPDGKAVVVTTKAGATFLKIDIASGKISTIMEHVKGQPGFRCHPEIVRLSNGQMLCTGYFYDEKNNGGRNCLAILDPEKSGVVAFTKCSEIQKAQFAVRNINEMFYDTYPSKDVGFMAVNKGATCNFYVWKAGSDKPVRYDQVAAMESYWGSGDSILYSCKRADKNFDLVLYNGKTGEKTMISQGDTQPYYNVFMSQDGSTLLAGIRSANGQRISLYYAKAANNWKLEPVEKMKNIMSGITRISADGSKAFMFNESGFRVFELK